MKKAVTYNTILESERKRKTNFTRDMVEDLIMNDTIIIQRDAKYDGQYFQYDMLNQMAFEKVRNKLRQAMKDHSSGRFKTLVSPTDSMRFDSQLIEDNGFTSNRIFCARLENELETVFMRSSISENSSILDISISSIVDENSFEDVALKK